MDRDDRVEIAYRESDDARAAYHRLLTSGLAGGVVANLALIGTLIGNSDDNTFSIWLATPLIGFLYGLYQSYKFSETWQERTEVAFSLQLIFEEVEFIIQDKIESQGLSLDEKRALIEKLRRFKVDQKEVSEIHEFCANAEIHLDIETYKYIEKLFDNRTRKLKARRTALDTDAEKYKKLKVRACFVSIIYALVVLLAHADWSFLTWILLTLIVA